MRSAIGCLMLMFAVEARGQWLEVNINLSGGRWQVGSDASVKMFTRLGALAIDGKVGATHSLYTPTVNQYEYPISYSGQIVSHLTVTPDAQGALQGGCAYSYIEGYSMDANYAAPPRSLRSTRICWEERQPQAPGDEVVCPGPGCSSPIILALGRDQYDLTSPENGVDFDLRNEGTPRRVAWTEGGSQNAFLALDRDGNGRIDSGAELFGDHTQMPSGQLAANGFLALAQYDANADQTIDASDPIWSLLRIWIDANHDGSSDGELMPLASTGVVSIGLDYHIINRKDRWGNLFHYAASCDVRGARQSHSEPIYDVYLRSCSGER